MELENAMRANRAGDGIERAVAYGGRPSLAEMKGAPRHRRPAARNPPTERELLQEGRILLRIRRELAAKGEKFPRMTTSQLRALTAALDDEIRREGRAH